MSYTLTVTGSNYTVRNPATTILYSGTVIATAFSTLFSYTPEYVNDGTYTISAQIGKTSTVGALDGFLLTGAATAVIKSASSLGYMFLWSGGSSSGQRIQGCTLKNLIFDGGRTTSYPSTSNNGYSSGPGIKWADNVVVDGITVRNTIWSSTNTDGEGLAVYGSSGSINNGMEIKNCSFQNIHASGISVAYATGIVVHDCTFDTFCQQYPSGGGFKTDLGTDDITVYNCTFTGRTDNDGIYIGQSADYSTGVLIHDCDFDLQLYDQGGADYDPANPGGYAGGAIKAFANTVEVYNCDIDWNYTIAPGYSLCYVYGISVWGQGWNVHDNTIRDSYIGIGEQTSAYSSANTYTGNRIVGCDVGIIVRKTGCSVYGNKFEIGSRSSYTPIQNSGTSTVLPTTSNNLAGNLFDATATGRRKLTTSCNIATGIKLQGFQLVENEICYTETGATITVSAPTITGYTLDKIYVDGVGHNPVNGEYSFIVAAKNYTVSATYVGGTPPPVSYTFTTSIVGDGSVTKYPDQSTYPDGSSVILTAIPNLHWLFSGWSVDASGSDNPKTVTVTGNMNVTGTFEADPIPTQHMIKLTIPRMVVEIMVEEIV